MAAQFSNNPVRALVRENIRRFWPVSLVFFLILLCTVVIPAYLMKDGYYIDFPLTGAGPFLVFSEIIFPIVITGAVFSYLHSASGTALVHSLPLSRRTLFKGGFLSGFILTFSPVVIVFLAISPLYDFSANPGYYHFGGPYFLDWLAFAGMSLLVLFFIFALATLSASLTGNGVGLMAITFVLNFIVFFVYIIVSGFLDTFLIGFSSFSQSQEDILVRLNPLFYWVSDSFSRERNIAGFVIMILVYFAVACAAIFAAYRLYMSRKLETAGRPISFRFAEILVTYLITLVCMAGMGMLFYLQSTDYDYYSGGFVDFRLAVVSLIIGSAIGASVAFLVITMLVQKTPRVFTKKTLKDFGIFIIIGFLFISFTVFDLTGYTNRVPYHGQVKTAEITFSAYPFQYPYKDLYGYQLQNKMTVRAESGEDIKAVGFFHRGMIEHEKKYRSGYSAATDVFDPWRGSASFNYDLIGPFSMSRVYELHYRFSDIGLRETLAAMPGFRKSMMIENLFGYENISGFSVADHMGSKTELNLSSSEIQALARCMDDDFRRLSAVELAESSPDMELRLLIELRYPKSGNLEGYNQYEIDYYITPSYTDTLAFLGHKAAGT